MRHRGQGRPACRVAGRPDSPGRSHVGWTWDPRSRLGLQGLVALVVLAGLLMVSGGLVLVWRLDRQRSASQAAPVPSAVPFVSSSPTSTTIPLVSPSVELPQAGSMATLPVTVPPMTLTARPVVTDRVPSDDALRVQVAQMPLADKIGQMMMVQFDGQRLAESADLAALVSTYHVGGLVLLEANAHDPQQVAQLVDEVQRLAAQSGSQVPLFVSINHEGGNVVRISQGVTGFPGNMAIAATGRPEYAYAAAAMAAQELRAMGITMNLAPVLDVNDNPLNPVIGVRSFGESPDQVTLFGRETIKGFQQNGVMAVAKHFPGHGSTAVDSHVGLPTVNKTAAQLEQVELAPFRMAVTEGVEGIMTAHLVVPALETTPGLPASMSRAVVTGVLRQRMGFEGIILSDSLGMGAIAQGWGQPQAAVRAVQAGTDIVLASGPLETTTAMWNALVAAVQRGEISAGQIDASVMRILRAKHRYGLFENGLSGNLSVVGSGEHQAAADEMALAAVTLFRDQAGLVPLPGSARRLLVLSPSELPPAQDGGGTMLAQLLRDNGLEVAELIFDLDQLSSREAVYAQTVKAASGYDLILFGEWELLKRSANQSDHWQESLIAALLKSGRQVLMVVWRDPGAILLVPQVPTCLVAYGTTSAQVKAVAKVLIGQAMPQGHLPLTLVLPGH